MTQVFNVYCDESCHLEHDRQKVMVLGAIWCPLEKARETAQAIRVIKEKHGLGRDFEVKWTKVSPGKIDFYIALIDYFFAEPDLHFRALIAADKTRLQHEEYGQSHDEWYFKMYFTMLKAIFRPNASYQIYLDIKDTRSAPKVKKLWDVLCNNAYDFSREIIQRVQTVRSHEVEQVQLADLLIGAVAYANRDLSGSSAKQQLVKLIRKRSGYSLTRSTLYREDKLNLFQWTAQEADV
ncbi:MAG TPA: DUF3800 domain-containing protein [Candidatus Acetothermia bacterium]|nr:DUF3800 domain-containing protein [Candidatus Acetothermia bacterium]